MGDETAAKGFVGLGEGDGVRVCEAELEEVARDKVYGEQEDVGLHYEVCGWY